MRSLIRQLEEVKDLIDFDDARDILLNSFPKKDNNIIFTLSQITFQNLENILNI